MKPIYDIDKSYLENAEDGPFFDEPIPQRKWPPQDQWIDFLGFKVATPIGVPAGPLLNARWIDFAADLGFDIPVYKTIRIHEQPSHPLPNVVPVETKGQLIPGRLPEFVRPLGRHPDNMNELAITNSFGNPSRTQAYLRHDIPLALSKLHPGQVMIVSVFGTERNGITLTDDFVATAQFAKECGAPIIEANYSCPNLKAEEGCLYFNPDIVFEISSHIVKAIGETPLVIKVGAFPNKEIMRKSMIAAARAGVRAICGLNTISMKVEPPLDSKRQTCGICGAPIREAALEFIEKARKIDDDEKLDLTIIGCGGITLPEHFDLFLAAGADVAMTATGMMWDPFLALKRGE